MSLLRLYVYWGQYVCWDYKFAEINMFALIIKNRYKWAESYFVRFESVHHVDESWRIVTFLLEVRHNDKVLHVVWWPSIES